MLEFESRNQGPGCSPKVLLAIGAIAIVIFLAATWAAREPTDYEVAQQRLQLERAEALQPWTIGLGIAWRVLAIGFGLAIAMGLIGLMRVGLRHLDMHARLIPPDPETGQFPAVKVRRGEALVDLNRMPDGKVMTGVVGGRAGLLLVLLFRYVLGRDVPELTEQPAVLVTPPDTSPAQLAVTQDAQRVQMLAAVSRGTRPHEAGQALQAVSTPAHRPVGLPPLLVEAQQPREVQLLLEAGRRQWQREPDGDVVDADVRHLD